MATGKRERNGAKKVIEPVVNLSDEGNYIRVTAELPGIQEKTIRIDLEKFTLTLSAMGDGRTYKKELLLPAKMRFGKKRFRNGVLEISLEKTEGYLNDHDSGTNM